MEIRPAGKVQAELFKMICSLFIRVDNVNIEVKNNLNEFYFAQKSLLHLKAEKPTVPTIGE